jgi:tetratricopeptide (TPR) repeat protein
MTEPARMTTPVPQDTGFDPLEFWIRHKSKIVLYSGLLLGALIVFGIFEVTQQRTKVASGAAYAAAKTEDDFRKIAADYPRNVAGANAELMLAEQQRAAGKLDESLATLRNFVTKHPAHPLIAGAYASLGSVEEAKGDLGEALATYQKITTSFPNTYAAPLGWLGQARVLKAQGKTEEARRSYETVIGQFQQTAFANEAQRQVQSLKKETSAAEATPAPAVNEKPAADATPATAPEKKPEPVDPTAPASANKEAGEAQKPATVDSKAPAKP